MNLLLTFTSGQMLACHTLTAPRRFFQALIHNNYNSDFNLSILP
jgi:hypothetical protein